MKLALISLSSEGLKLAEYTASKIDNSSIFVHESIKTDSKYTTFARVTELTAEIFSHFGGLAYFMPCGVVVRAVANCLKSKLSDPAVVVVDVGARYTISLLSGHEGGANRLAFTIGNILAAEPVISTTTEAVKTVIAGIGCRRGITAEEITNALSRALKIAGVKQEELRLLASAELKADEAGLLQAAVRLSLPLRFISSEEIINSRQPFTHSEFVKKKTGLPAVAEPAALLAGRRTKLILKKTIFTNLTVALARENCILSGLAQVTP